MLTANPLSWTCRMLRVGVVLLLATSVTLMVPRSHADECKPRWSALTGTGGVGVDGPAATSVYALAEYDDGSGPALYVGGVFTTAGGVVAHGIARWNGETWSALAGPSGVGVDGQVRALAVFDDGTGPNLYVGGSFTLAGGVTVNNIARWDGAQWSALDGPGGVGVSSWVDAMVVYDDGSGPALHVGGDFIVAGGVSVNRIAKWNGHAWSALATPVGVGVTGGTVHALTVFEDGAGDRPALFVGGGFGAAGGVTASRIARWDGATWSALAGPGGEGVWGIHMGGLVYALAVFDGGAGSSLHVGGDFETAGGGVVNGIAAWDGSDWSALGGPSGSGVEVWVEEMTEFQSGTTRVLCVGGLIHEAGGVIVDHIACWNGNAWSPLEEPGGNGVSGPVAALAVFDDGSGPALYAGGGFATAGDTASNCVAKWGCRQPPPCRPDVNGDGELDILDFLDFIDSFAECEARPAPCAGSSGVSADYNGDTIVDILDFLDFFDDFGSGC